MNGPDAEAMNEAIGTTVDSPERVADAIAPTLVDSGMAKSRAEISRHLDHPAPAIQD